MKVVIYTGCNGLPSNYLKKIFTKNLASFNLKTHSVHKMLKQTLKIL